LREKLYWILRAIVVAVILIHQHCITGDVVPTSKVLSELLMVRHNRWLGSTFDSNRYSTMQILAAVCVEISNLEDALVRQIELTLATTLGAGIAKHSDGFCTLDDLM
jgi:hypothetical protein